jgi:hypothetical protein
LALVVAPPASAAVIITLFRAMNSSLFCACTCPGKMRIEVLF